MLIIVSCQDTTVKPLAIVTPVATTVPSTTRSTIVPKLGTHRDSEARSFIDAPDLDLFALTQDLITTRSAIRPSSHRESIQYSPGRIDTFWLIDLTENMAYQSDFELITVTPHAYWYLETGMDIDRSSIERSASIFEEIIYPNVSRIFGTEWRPGIDNDLHLSILNADLNTVAGYFSSSNEYPSVIIPTSNQREIIYMNARHILPGSSAYSTTLAHELQHAIHWNADASEDTWVNEGLSELATSITFDNQYSIQHFLRAGPVSLINWPKSPSGMVKNYGSSSLFMHFLTEHFGGREDLKPLLSQPADSIAGINSYLDSLGYEERFEDVFRLWAAANLVDGEGRLGYNDLSIEASVSKTLDGFGKIESEIPQYAIEYIELESITEPVQISFNGAINSRLLPTDVGSNGCWWSNSGDSIDSTLTSTTPLSADSHTVLEYEVWYETEKDWDYIYVEVSLDSGETWQIIGTPGSSSKNPIGHSFGPGYTGASDGWVQESVNLSSYAGEELMIRLQYITDDAINGSGGCFRDFTVSGSSIFSVVENWDANGFIFVDNIVRQEFQVQIIVMANPPEIHTMRLSEGNTGDIYLNEPQIVNRIVVATGALAEKTRQPAIYSLDVKPTG